MNEPMTDMNAEIASIVETITAEWAKRHPDIPSDRISFAASVVIGAKMGNLLRSLRMVADNDPTRVTTVEITIDWVHDIDAGLAELLRRGDLPPSGPTQ